MNSGSVDGAIGLSTVVQLGQNNILLNNRGEIYYNARVVKHCGATNHTFSRHKTTCLFGIDPKVM